MVNSSRFAFDPRIDKPWGSTLREKLPRSVRLRYVNWGSKECQQAFLAPLPGIGNSNPREIYLSFWTNPNFIIAYILCFLFVSMNAGKTLDTKWLRSSHSPGSAERTPSCRQELSNSRVSKRKKVEKRQEWVHNLYSTSITQTMRL